MATWVDPRSNPAPPYNEAPRPLADSPEEIEPLIDLCEDAAIYAVERWIQDGKPLQARPSDKVSPGANTAMRSAIRQQLGDLVLLLLCNGYDLNADPWSPLDDALAEAPYRYLDTLLSWGADPTRADPELVVTTYTTAIITRFLDAGLDIVKNNCMAHALGHHSSNRALYGIARAQRLTTPGFQRALDAALGCQARRANARGIALCRWAGANPRTLITYSWRSNEPLDEDDPEGRRYDAFELALDQGHPELLDALGFDAASDDVQRLYRFSLPVESVRFLVKIAPPTDWGPIIGWQLMFAKPFKGDYPRFYRFKEYLDLGARLTEPNTQFREELPKIIKLLHEHDRRSLVRWLFDLKHCTPIFLADLLTRPVLRQVFQAERIPKDVLMELAALKDSHPDAAAFARSRHTKAQDAQPIGLAQKTYDRPYACSRAELAKAVWERPVEQVAAVLGITGTALRKTLRHLKIPGPPRGYWAKLQAGQRPPRPPMPPLRPGAIETIYLKRAPGTRSVPDDAAQSEPARPAPSPPLSPVAAAAPPAPTSPAPTFPASKTEPGPAVSGDRFGQYNHWQRRHIFSQMNRGR